MCNPTSGLITHSTGRTISKLLKLNHECAIKNWSGAMNQFAILVDAEC